jgi:hypothetical protein
MQNIQEESKSDTMLKFEQLSQVKELLRTHQKESPKTASGENPSEENERIPDGDKTNSRKYLDLAAETMAPLEEEVRNALEANHWAGERLQPKDPEVLKLHVEVGHFYLFIFECLYFDSMLLKRMEYLRFIPRCVI